MNIQSMNGETDLATMLKTLHPKHNPGEYVFCVVEDSSKIHLKDVVMVFHEAEGTTLILRKETADTLQLEYSFIAAWITLTIHSSLEAVGLTAAFSNALAKHGISCNVVAAFYHDHLFVDQKHTNKALAVLRELSV